MSGSINDLRCGSRYFEKMRKLFHEFPEMQKHLQERKCSENKCNILLSSCSWHNLNSALKKRPKGIRGQTNHQAYATDWELSYQEVPAISKGYGEISKSVMSNADANPLHKELRNRNILEYYNITMQQTVFFIKERPNSCETPMPIHPAK